MEDQLGTRGRERLRDRLAIAHVHDAKVGAGRECMFEVRLLAGREVVDHGHPVAPGDQRVDQVRADEAGASGDEAVHRARRIVGPLHSGRLPSPRRR